MLFSDPVQVEPVQRGLNTKFALRKRSLAYTRKKNIREKTANAALNRAQLAIASIANGEQQADFRNHFLPVHSSIKSLIKRPFDGIGIPGGARI
jgi:hypothetical protein